MSQPQRYVVHLLSVLQKVLEEQGRGSESAMIAQVLEKVGHASELQPALEELFAVKGMDMLALRLMWYAERMKAQGETLPPDRVVEYQVRQLATDIGPSENTPPAETEAARPPKRVEIPPDWEAAVRHFGDSLDELRKEAFEGERFIGLQPAKLDSLLMEADALREGSADAGYPEVSRFSAAFSQFVRYVADHELLHDIRVLNFLESANLTLQTAVQTLGPDDYDSLLQTSELLENPKTLLEFPTHARE